MRTNIINCDNCKDEIENIECVENQMRFILQEQMDEGKSYDFCGAECLKEFINTKRFEKRFYSKSIETAECGDCRILHSPQNCPERAETTGENKNGIS